MKKVAILALEESISSKVVEVVIKGFIQSVGFLLMVVGSVAIIASTKAWNPNVDGSFNWTIVLVGILCAIVGFIMIGEMNKEYAREKVRKREADARSRIRNIFTQAGYESAEVDERAKLAEMLLRERTGDWTVFGLPQLAPIIQAVDVLRNNKR
jgi:hypothetical protein